MSLVYTLTNNYSHIKVDTKNKKKILKMLINIQFVP